jgi:phosphoribosylformimino-5-aminoimidazole carboxamide ribotide isomerase
MLIFPAIDLYGGKAVRLYKGDYNNMTVYSEHPEEVALEFKKSGATNLHLVDLEGARDGTTPNIETVKRIRNITDAFIEIGGGIRSMETVKTYIDAGVDRVILGTAAVNDRAFLLEAVKTYKEKIAVGVDIKDGFVAIKG